MKLWARRVPCVALLGAALAYGCGDDGGGGSSTATGGSGGTAEDGGSGGTVTGGGGSTGGGTSGGSGGSDTGGSGGSATAGAPSGGGGSGGASTGGMAGAGGDATTCPDVRPQQGDSCDEPDGTCDYARFTCVCTAYGWLCLGEDPGTGGTAGAGGAAASDCPASEPSGQCDNADWLLNCAYGDTNCTCTPQGWICFGSGAGGAGGAGAAPDCPSDQPAGTCDALLQQCSYGDLTCTCIPRQNQTLRWQCLNAGAGG